MVRLRSICCLLLLIALAVYQFGGDAFRERADWIARRVSTNDLGENSQGPSQGLPLLGSPAAIDAAYESIPHRRTEFDFSSVELPLETATYLQRVFALLDQAVVWRVQSMWRLRHNAEQDQVQGDAERLLAFARECRPPVDLGAYHRRIERAIQLQAEFFAQESAATLDATLQQRGSDPRLQAISDQLLQAHVLLTHALRTQSPHNANAIFDYHCAFDFL